MLMPAAVMVLLVLGAITFDYAHLYLAKRDLQSAAEASANDAITFGIDQAAVRRGEGVRVDEDALRRAVDASLALHAAQLHLVGAPDIELIGPSEVRVTVTGRVDFVFVPAMPGAAHSELVHATAVATAAG